MSDQVDLLRSIVDGAADDNNVSNASKPTLSDPLLGSFEQQVGTNKLGSCGMVSNRPALIEHVPMSIIKTFLSNRLDGELFVNGRFGFTHKESDLSTICESIAVFHF